MTKLWKAQNTDQAEYVGLLESGNYEIDHDVSDDENLQELIEDLKSYYQDGKGYQSDRFSCNDRM